VPMFGHVARFDNAARRHATKNGRCTARDSFVSPESRYRCRPGWTGMKLTERESVNSP
jgi:hypothetical protein